MRLLLDTHVMLWWLRDVPKLGPRTRAVMAAPEAELLVSVASFWELAIKARNGRFAELGSDIFEEVEAQGIQVLAVQRSHLAALERLPRVPEHNDPFDHLILAQTLAEDAVLVTSDRQMRRYGVRCA